MEPKDSHRPAPPRVLRLRDVCDLTKLSPSTIRRKEKAGEFPLHVRLGKNAVGWLESEVHEWLWALQREQGNGSPQRQDRRGGRGR